MDTELRKRLEGVAKKYALEHKAEWLPQNCYASEHKEGFLTGAKYGYKEVIEQAKKWLTTSFFQCLGEDGVYWDSAYTDIVESLNCFEIDMNKLWEDKK